MNMKTIYVTTYMNKYIYEISINRLLAYCKGGNFNIHIWAWFGYFICLGREIRFDL